MLTLLVGLLLGLLGGFTVGSSVGALEGSFEGSLLGFNVGIDLNSPGLRLPFVGRIGFDDRSTSGPSDATPGVERLPTAQAD